MDDSMEGCWSVALASSDNLFVSAVGIVIAGTKLSRFSLVLLSASATLALAAWLALGIFTGCGGSVFAGFRNL
jgi:hypothetical protein